MSPSQMKCQMWGAPDGNGFPWEVREVWTERGLFDRKRQQPTTILCIYIYIYLVVVSSIFYFHPYLGKIPILTNIFQMG